MGADEGIELTITPEDQQRASTTVREQQLQYAESMAVRYLAQLGPMERELTRLNEVIEGERAIRASKEALWGVRVAELEAELSRPRAGGRNIELEQTVNTLRVELRRSQDESDDLTERLGHMEGERDAARTELAEALGNRGSTPES